MKPFIRELRIKNPLDAFAALEHLPYSLLLDSADLEHPNGRYSFIVSHPIETIESKDGRICLTNWGEQKHFEDEDVFKLIDARLKHWIPETETIRGLPLFKAGPPDISVMIWGAISRICRKMRRKTPMCRIWPSGFTIRFWLLIIRKIRRGLSPMRRAITKRARSRIIFWG